MQELQQKTVGTLVSTWVFGETPYTFPNFEWSPGGSVGPHSSSGTFTVALNGLNLLDRIHVSQRIHGSTDGMVLYAADPVSNNLLSARWVNPTGGVLSLATRDVIVTIARNDAFRQVFALSVHLGKDMWFCAVDSDTNNVSTIFETVNAGSSWAPIFATLSKGVRDFVIVNDNTDNTASPYVNNTVLALLSDPANGDDMLVRTTDGGDSWSAVTFTRSTAPAETGLLSGALEGDQKSGGSRVIVGSARQVGNTATVFISTDSGVTFGSPITVATGHNNIWWVEYISGTGASGIWLAFCHDQGGTLAPVVYQTIDGGANWSSLSTVGAAGDVWQAVHKTSQGALLATTDNNGRVYRSTNNGASWTLVFETANVIATETKMRRFIENSTAIYCVSQNAGYLWRSTDDGINYTVIDRAGRQFGPICFSGTETRILIGGGQGFTGAGPGRAEMYVATIVDN